MLIQQVKKLKLKKLIFQDCVHSPRGLNLRMKCDDELSCTLPGPKLRRVHVFTTSLKQLLFFSVLNGYHLLLLVFKASCLFPTSLFTAWRTERYDTV